MATLDELLDREDISPEVMEVLKRLSSFIQNSKDAIYSTTVDGFMDFSFPINQATLDIFGYTEEEMKNIHLNDIYADSDDRKKFQEEIKEKGYVRDYEIRFRRKSGKEIQCLVTANPRYVDGEITGYEGTIRNVTEQRKIEEHLGRIQKIDAVEKMGAGVAHELRNTLTPIIAYAEILSRGDSDQERIKNIQKQF